MRRTILRHLGGLAVLAAAAVGCGGKPGIPLGEVEGVVTLDDKPLDTVVVHFLPDLTKGAKGPQSSAVTDANGRYRLKCADSRDGAAIGWHKVLVEDPGEGNYDPNAAVLPATVRISHVYKLPTTSPLAFEVKEGKQTIDIQVTKPR